jgi:3-oxoacyl-[acyl-carrier protein] reductase
MTEARTDRVAIVTGGSGGIGQATSLRLSRDCSAVVVHYSGSEKKPPRLCSPSKMLVARRSP